MQTVLESRPVIRSNSDSTLRALFLSPHWRCEHVVALMLLRDLRQRLRQYTCKYSYATPRTHM